MMIMIKEEDTEEGHIEYKMKIDDEGITLLHMHSFNGGEEHLSDSIFFTYTEAFDKLRKV